MSARRDDDIETLLDDLQTTLDRLQDELHEEQTATTTRPPTFGDVLRFTDEYTIPTVIAVLETTIQSLELLRGLLRLMDPSRAGESARSGRPRIGTSRLDDAGRFATDRVAGALSDLQRALAETDLPDDPSARSIVEEARSLSAELERRLDETTATREPSRERSARDRGVQIPVADDESDATDDGTAVDVESELESIKDEVKKSDDESA